MPRSGDFSSSATEIIPSIRTFMAVTRHLESFKAYRAYLSSYVFVCDHMGDSKTKGQEKSRSNSCDAKTIISPIYASFYKAHVRALRSNFHRFSHVWSLSYKDKRLGLTLNELVIADKMPKTIDYILWTFVPFKMQMVSKSPSLLPSVLVSMQTRISTLRNLIEPSSLEAVKYGEHSSLRRNILLMLNAPSIYSEVQEYFLSWTMSSP